MVGPEHSATLGSSPSNQGIQQRWVIAGNSSSQAGKFGLDGSEGGLDRGMVGAEDVPHHALVAGGQPTGVAEAAGGQLPGARVINS